MPSPAAGATDEGGVIGTGVGGIVTRSARATGVALGRGVATAGDGRAGGGAVDAAACGETSAGGRVSGSRVSGDASTRGGAGVNDVVPATDTGGPGSGLADTPARGRRKNSVAPIIVAPASTAPITMGAA